MRALILFSSVLFFAAGCDPSIFQFDGEGNGDGDGGQGFDASTTPDAAPIDADLTPDACVPQPEVCDNADNDCDGTADEGFDLTEDNANCGACGEACDLLAFHALGDCNNSVCEFTCQAGFLDEDGDLNTDPTVPGFDGCEYQCIPTNGGVEICDLIDNDCNFATDEGFDLQNNVNNCGQCGKVCQTLNATPECSAGECGFVAGSCTPGFLDFDGNSVNGCEYQCPVFSGTACPNGNSDCSGAETCIAGFCIEPETCNGVDDDCDGVVDGPTVVGLGQPCDPPDCGNGICSDEGTCVRGVQSCNFGQLLCDNAVGPQADICDDLDNDCDGTADQGFDKQNDIDNCGACGFVCQDQAGFDNVAIPNCTNGLCGIAQCVQDFHDLDGDPTNGCEVSCQPSGPEICDGIDNDCDCPNVDTNNDGVFCGPGDENVDQLDANPPDLFVTVNNFCRTDNECAGTQPTCVAGSTAVGCDPSVDFRCVYLDPDVEVDACGDIVPQELLCDGLDNDCDNAFDEAAQYAQKGAVCKEDGTLGTTAEQGICQGTGLVDCNSTNDGLVCNIDTDPFDAPGLGFEECDGEDDDCDSNIDEAVDLVNDTVVVSDGIVTFSMFVHEASRPDAVIDSAGTLSTNPNGGSAAACSVDGVLPWVTVTKTEADAACAAAGGRLCTETEWELACAGTAGHLYPYNSSIQGCLAGPNAGTVCTVDSECAGTCVNGADATKGDPCVDDTPCANQCRNGDNEGAACVDNTPCTGGGFCDIGTCSFFACGDVYVDDACNGRDFDPAQDAVIPTGAAAVCESEFSIFDLSGNVKEWTDTEVSTNIFRVRGGSFDNVEQGLTCDFDFVAFNQNIAFPNLGFRCCF